MCLLSAGCLAALAPGTSYGALLPSRGSGASGRGQAPQKKERRNAP
uniref:Uncharacterized protein n=1 Tax=Siphoviridae sp. ctP6113 TaxID=2826318 RepID=A0A8S5MU49_9CAUD|nr:MAG TPA: hypothetical protein [Siphoviridae sp. ctP6113]